jgi:hypothetical protein
MHTCLAELRIEKIKEKPVVVGNYNHLKIANSIATFSLLIVII